MQKTKETEVPSLGQENSLEEEMATYSSILAWEIRWTEEPGGLQSMGSRKVGHSERLSTYTSFVSSTPCLYVALLPPLSSLVTASSLCCAWRLSHV